MANLIKLINLIYFLFLIITVSFFYHQFSLNVISIETLEKTLLLSVSFVLVLFFAYRSSRKCFDFAIKKIEVSQKIAVPILMLVFIGGFSVALSIVFVAFLESVGILFTVGSFGSLMLNILALLSFFWMAFILFMGWDFIKIIGTVSQYAMLKGIEEKKKSDFFGSMMKFFKLSLVRDAFVAFAAVDLACRCTPKLFRVHYKNMMFPIKIWSACLIVYKGMSVVDALQKSFEYFKKSPFNIFYTKNLSALFLPIVIVPIGMSLITIILNINYFSILQCFYGNCFFAIIIFLVFMSLGFFFSYSIIISLESAYYVKILTNIERGKIVEVSKQIDVRVNFIEEETYRRISKLRGNFWDVFRVYF